MTANGTLHVPDNPPSKPSSPASPTSSFQNQQSVAPRSFINLNPPVRGQSSPFPSTPISSHMNGLLEPPPGVTYGDFIRTWTDNHVARWLTDIKCGTHAGTFRANDIRGDILLELDQVTLKEMGVSSIGDRLRIVNAVKALRQRTAARPVLDTTRPNRLGVEYGGDTVDGVKGLSESPEPSPTTRLASRRLGRPAPLQLNSSSSRSDLPRLVREQPPDSARLNPNPGIRPLPNPTQVTPVPPTNTLLNTPNSTHSSSTAPLRPNLPPLPPPPRGQPPLPPPSRVPARSVLNSGSQHNGRRTPTQADSIPSYAAQPLPPAPQNQNLLTPSSASNWTGYHLPVDPRPGNLGGGKPPAAGRSTSPLPPGRGPRPNISNPTHGRNVSLGVGSPNTSSPNKLPSRPATSNSHPYANAQPALQPPTAAQQAYNLSPIAESFMTQHSSASGSPSPPSLAYTVGRGPFNPSPSHSNAPSLDDLRRKLVKFWLPDEGLSFTIDVDTCAGGIEVLEKVLKKFGKGGSRSADSEGAMDHVQTDEGGLSVDGWGVYLDWGQDDGPGTAFFSFTCHSHWLIRLYR
jgi:mitogen-activated protein kinase kinase kinase